MATARNNHTRDHYTSENKEGSTVPLRYITEEEEEQLLEDNPKQDMIEQACDMMRTAVAMLLTEELDKNDIADGFGSAIKHEAMPWFHQAILEFAKGAKECRARRGPMTPGGI